MVISFILHALLVLKRIFLVPAVKILALPFRSSFITERSAFEDNINFRYCTSFHVDRLKADILFHVSSEGELEQIHPLLERFLHQGSRVELVFTSDSVERKCHLLGEKYYPNLRMLPLPLLGTMANFHLEDWATAKTLVMCRYDFFPELLYFATLCNQRYLVGASVKKYRQELERPLSFATLYWKTIFYFFDRIIPSTQQDRINMERLTSSYKVLAPLDMRVLRIDQRIKQGSEKIDQRLGSAFRQYIVHQKKTVIIGSCWEAEREILQDHEIQQALLTGELFIYVAPHRLDQQFLEEFNSFTGAQIPSATISKEMDCGDIDKLLDTRPALIYSQVPGLLCEIYSLFDIAFVGGGWGRSVHSVLEPYLAGCSVVCGPKVFRSTEVDIIQQVEADRLKILEKPQDFFQSIKGMDKNKNGEMPLLNTTRVQFDQLVKLLHSSRYES